MKKYFCFIPAKSKSKRVAQKNKQMLGTKPLFYYPTKLALDSKLFKQDEIVFSSDSEQILDEANKVGNIFSIKRDLNL